MNIGDLVKVKKSVSSTLYGDTRGIVIDILRDENYDFLPDDDYDWFDITVMTSDGVTMTIPGVLLEVIVND